MTAESNAAARKPRKKPSPSAAARQEEADDGHVVIEHRGIELRVPVRGKRPVAAVDAFRAGDNYEGIKRTLGDEQWKLLSDAGLTLDDLDEIDEKLAAALGN